MCCLCAVEAATCNSLLCYWELRVDCESEFCLSCFWEVWPPPGLLPLSATGLELKFQSVVVDDGVDQSGEKDLKSVCRVVGFGIVLCAGGGRRRRECSSY